MLKPAYRSPETSVWCRGGLGEGHVIRSDLTRTLWYKRHSSIIRMNSLKIIQCNFFLFFFTFCLTVEVFLVVDWQTLFFVPLYHYIWSCLCCSPKDYQTSLQIWSAFNREESYGCSQKAVRQEGSSKTETSSYILHFLCVELNCGLLWFRFFL